MSSRIPQIITAVGAILVAVIALLLVGGADALFPVPTPTAAATATYTAAPTQVPSPTLKPIAANLALAYTNDTLGYLDPCSA